MHDERLGWGHVDLTAATNVTDHEVTVEFDNLVISTPGPPHLLEAVRAR